jgi:hypothetical protein
MGVDTPELRDSDPRVKAAAFTARDWMRARCIDDAAAQGEEPTSPGVHRSDRLFVVRCHEFDKYGRLLADVYDVGAHFTDDGDDRRIRFQLVSTSCTDEPETDIVQWVTDTMGAAPPCGTGPQQYYGCSSIARELLNRNLARPYTGGHRGPYILSPSVVTV